MNHVIKSHKNTEFQEIFKMESPLTMEKSKAQTHQTNGKQMSYSEIGTGINLCRKWL